MSATYSDKEISEWNSNDLSNWLLDNKYRGISELCQKYSLTGYDLFFITDEVLKKDLGLSSFHERIVTKKLVNKLTSEHLKLNIINSNGDNVILTLDNNPNTTIGDISQYIGNMFDIEPTYILYKDSTKQEVLSPTLKIIQLMILYPRIYKTLNISNMKDYHQIDDKATNNENNEGINSISKTGDTISRTIDKNDENEKIVNKYKIKNNIPPQNNNITYSFGDNSRDLNSGSISNNYKINENKYYQEIPPMNYKPNSPSDLSDENQNNNGSIISNEKQNQNQMNNKMMQQNLENNHKYKSERRVYRDSDKDELYYNYKNMQNNQTEYMSENRDKNMRMMTSSSNDENENENGNEDEEVKYKNRNFDESNDLDNRENYRNNYGIINNRENNGYKKYKEINDMNNNYYAKEDYENENPNNNENRNRRIKSKKGINDNVYKGKIFNENYNDSNPISNNYYKQ